MAKNKKKTKKMGNRKKKEEKEKKRKKLGGVGVRGAQAGDSGGDPCCGHRAVISLF